MSRSESSVSVSSESASVEEGRHLREQGPAMSYLSSVLLGQPEGFELMSAEECDDYLMSNLAEIWSSD